MSTIISNRGTTLQGEKSDPDRLDPETFRFQYIQTRPGPEYWATPGATSTSADCRLFYKNTTNDDINPCYNFYIYKRINTQSWSSDTKSRMRVRYSGGYSGNILTNDNGIWNGKMFKYYYYIQYNDGLLLYYNLDISTPGAGSNYHAINWDGKNTITIYKINKEYIGSDPMNKQNINISDVQSELGTNIIKQYFIEIYDNNGWDNYSPIKYISNKEEFIVGNQLVAHFDGNMPMPQYYWVRNESDYNNDIILSNSKTYTIKKQDVGNCIELFITFTYSSLDFHTEELWGYSFVPYEVPQIIMVNDDNIYSKTYTSHNSTTKRCLTPSIEFHSTQYYVGDTIIVTPKNIMNISGYAWYNNDDNQNCLGNDSVYILNSTNYNKKIKCEIYYDNNNNYIEGITENPIGKNLHSFDINVKIFGIELDSVDYKFWPLVDKSGKPEDMSSRGLEFIVNSPTSSNKYKIIVNDINDDEALIGQIEFYYGNSIIGYNKIPNSSFDHSPNYDENCGMFDNYIDDVTDDKGHYTLRQNSEIILEFNDENYKITKYKIWPGHGANSKTLKEWTLMNYYNDEWVIIDHQNSILNYNNDFMDWENIHYIDNLTEEHHDIELEIDKKYDMIKFINDSFEWSGAEISKSGPYTFYKKSDKYSLDVKNGYGVATNNFIDITLNKTLSNSAYIKEITFTIDDSSDNLTITPEFNKNSYNYVIHVHESPSSHNSYIKIHREISDYAIINTKCNNEYNCFEYYTNINDYPYLFNSNSIDNIVMIVYSENKENEAIYNFTVLLEGLIDFTSPIEEISFFSEKEFNEREQYPYPLTACNMFPPFSSNRVTYNVFVLWHISTIKWGYETSESDFNSTLYFNHINNYYMLDYTYDEGGENIKYTFHLHRIKSDYTHIRNLSLFDAVTNSPIIYNLDSFDQEAKKWTLSTDISDIKIIPNDERYVIYNSIGVKLVNQNSVFDNNGDQTNSLFRLSGHSTVWVANSNTDSTYEPSYIVKYFNGNNMDDDNIYEINNTNSGWSSNVYNYVSPTFTFQYSKNYTNDTFLLDKGRNNIKITSTAKNGTKDTYTLKVNVLQIPTRSIAKLTSLNIKIGNISLLLDPPFEEDNVEYKVIIPYDTKSLFLFWTDYYIDQYNQITEYEYIDNIYDGLVISRTTHSEDQLHDRRYSIKVIKDEEFIDNPFVSDSIDDCQCPLPSPDNNTVGYTIRGINGDITYQWYRDDYPINGATHIHYKTIPEDVGHVISLKMTVNENTITLYTSNVAAAGLDPYIKTLSGEFYKMSPPTKGEYFRMIQGTYEDKLFTINAKTRYSTPSEKKYTLYYVENKILEYERKNPGSTKAIKANDYIDYNNTYFSELYIQYGDEHILINMDNLSITNNDSNFELKTSEELPDIVNKTMIHLPELSHYACETERVLKINITKWLSVILSYSENPQVRGSFVIENVDAIQKPKGALVHKAYEKDIKIKKINDLRTLKYSRDRQNPKRITMECYANNNGETFIKEIPIY